MDQILNKFVEFGNYLLSINNDDEKKTFILGDIINPLPQYKLIYAKNITPQNDADDDGSIENNCSQYIEWVNTFGLENTPDNKASVLEYINYFVSVQSQLNI